MSTSATEYASVEPQGDVNIAELLRALWSSKGTIVVSVVVAIALAVLYLHVTRPTYTIELKVAPAQPTSGPNVSNAASKLGGLASLAGITLSGSGNSSPFEMYLEGLHSLTAADTLARDPEIMRGVFSDEWDAAAGRWKQPTGALDPIKDALKSVLGIPEYPWSPPNGLRLREYLSKHVTFSDDPKKSIVTIQYHHSDPTFGKKLLAELHGAVDRNLRSRSSRRSADYIRYLSAKLSTVAVPEYRQTIVATLGEQERVQMMASSVMPFAADPTEAPVASIRPTSPLAAVALGLAVLLGLFIGISIALVRASNAQQRRISTGSTA